MSSKTITENRKQINKETKPPAKKFASKHKPERFYNDVNNGLKPLHPEKSLTANLNLRFKEKIYEDLISVNVNDLSLESIYSKMERQSSTKLKPTIKDAEPTLGDYLNPIQPLELKIEKCDYSSTNVEKAETFDYHRFYHLFKALNVDL